MGSVILLALFMFIQWIQTGNPLDLHYIWLMVAGVPTVVGLAALGYRVEVGKEGFKIEPPKDEFLKLAFAPQEPGLSPARGEIVKEARTFPTRLEGGAWQLKHSQEYERTNHFMLAHFYRPSEKEPRPMDLGGVRQKWFEVFLFVVKHDKGSPGPPRKILPEIEKAEFFLGESWHDQTFEVNNENGNVLGIQVLAYGTFLATCRVTLKGLIDPAHKHIVLHRFVDFSMFTESKPHVST